MYKNGTIHIHETNIPKVDTKGFVHEKSGVKVSCMKMTSGIEYEISMHGNSIFM